MMYNYMYVSLYREIIIERSILISIFKILVELSVRFLPCHLEEIQGQQKSHFRATINVIGLHYIPLSNQQAESVVSSNDSAA